MAVTFSQSMKTSLAHRISEIFLLAGQAAREAGPLRRREERARKQLVLEQIEIEERRVQEEEEQREGFAGRFPQEEGCRFRLNIYKVLKPVINTCWSSPHFVFTTQQTKIQ